MYVDVVVVVSQMSDVGGWYGHCWQRCVIIGSDSARWLMSVAGMVEVGRLMSWCFEVH